MDSDNQSSKLPTPIDGGNLGIHNTIPGVQGSPAVSATEQPTPSVNTNSFSMNPMDANDDDLIEKEWVDRVDKIVSQHRDDPFNQLKELNALKADYIKKRYNKIIQEGE